MELSDIWGPAADRLLIVGLTGGIASGKTEVATELERLGARVIDADVVAREVVKPGNPAYEKIVDEFGKGILDEEGRIARDRLAEIVFADDRKRRLLNEITHPAIFLEIVKQVTEYADGLSAGKVPAVVIDAALIVDAGVSSVFDILLVVTAEDSSRVARLIENRGISEEEARERISSQVPEAERVNMADTVITNNGSIGELRIEVRKVWEQISVEALELYS